MFLNDTHFDSIIFDLDGTLWDSTDAIITSRNYILNSRSDIAKKSINYEELKNCMGLVMYDIAAALFPDETTPKQKEIMDALIVYENEYLRANGGKLYEGLERTLKVLMQKFPLYIVSNCQSGYIEAFMSAHKLERYFADFECWGNTGVSKDKSIRILMDRNQLKNPVYVGDTLGDANAAHMARIPFIYASYGFGDVPPANYIAEISAVGELAKRL